MLRKIFSLIEGGSQVFAVLLSQTIMHGIRPLLSYLECKIFCEEVLENPVKLWSLLVVVSSQILTTKCCKTPRVPTSLHWEGIRWQKMWVVVSILPLSATSTLFFLRKWLFSERKVNGCQGFVSNSYLYWVAAHLECLIPMWFLTGP